MNKANKFANITLTACIAILILAFFKLLSVREFYPSGKLNIYLGVIPIVIVVLFIILIKLGAEAKIRTALLILSLGMCILFVEILLEKYRSSVVNMPGWFMRIEAAKKAGVPYDSRTRYQTLMDLREESKDIYMAIGPSALVRRDGYFDKEAAVYPLGSMSNRRLLACNEHGEWLTYWSDEHGFRNPKGVYDNDIDIVLVGDSFTQGHCVNDGDDIAGWLRKKTGMNVLNVGMGSNGPLIELATIKEFAEPFKPKVVFMFYYPGNDMESIASEINSPILIKYLEEDFSQNLLEKQKIIDSALIKYAENELLFFEKEHSKAPDPNKKYKMSWDKVFSLYNLRYRISFRSECSFTIDPLFKDIVVRADSMVRKWGGQFVFVYLTAMDTYLAQKEHNSCRVSYYESQRHQLFPLLEELGIAYIDIEKAFADYDDMASLFPSFYHGHYNAKGYSMVAKEAENYMKKHNLLSHTK